MNLGRRVGIILGLLLATQQLRAAGAVVVDGFTPQGTVKQVTQVKAHFSAEMVAFGDPRPTGPFEIQCPAKGSGRWVDSRNWVFDFSAELPAGIRCEFRLKPGLKSLSGEAVQGESVYAFSSGGPAILQTRPYEGSQDVNEDQVFVLSLDAEPNEASVLKNLSFSVEGIQEKVGARFITGRAKRQIIKQSYIGSNEKYVYLVQPKQQFPSNAKVSLIWGSGILSKTGVPTERDQVIHFAVRPPFRAEFSCERERKEADCIPLSPFRVAFSAPLSSKEADRFFLADVHGKRWEGKKDGEGSGVVRSITYKGPFPEQTELTLGLKGIPEDDFARPLSNADKFPLIVKTDAYPALAKFPSSFGILEAKGNPLLPVTVRNLEPEVKTRLLGGAGRVERVKEALSTGKGKRWKLPEDRIGDILYWIKRVEGAKRNRSVFSDMKSVGNSSVASPGTNDFRLPETQGPNEFEVVGIPMPAPGFYVVELESSSLGAALLKKRGSMYVPTTVLVTNLGVHFKWGREASIAWVTRLDDAEPVQGANIEVRDCRGRLLWSGKTDATGVAAMGELPAKKDVPSCNGIGDYNTLNSGLLVTAERDNDMSFVHSSWDNGIEPWRFQVPTEYDPNPLLAHTLFDRSLLRAGDTLHMKHVLRRHTMSGIASADQLPRAVILEHDGSGQKYEFPVHWQGAGIAETEWQIPKEAKLGEYSVQFVFENKKKKRTVNSGTFRVEEFRVPLMKAVVQPPAQDLVAVDTLPVEISVSYLSGGGASKLPVKLRGQIQPRYSWPGQTAEDFVFPNGRVEEGRTHESNDEAQTSESSTKKNILGPMDLTLDSAGTAHGDLKGLPLPGSPYEVFTELQYADPNGETQTTATSVPIFPASRLIGIKLDTWTSSHDQLKPSVIVTDLQGKPVVGAPVTVNLFEKKTYSNRRRIVGGFYAYDNYDETKLVGKLCEGKTGVGGILVCEGKSPISGNVILQATTQDAEGRGITVHDSAWIAGEEEWWFSMNDHDRMDVIPEQKRYEPGQTAKFQVRMPFREATALITVEREGVMDVYVRKLSGKEPVVELPVRANYAPNVYVSVMAVRGRSGESQPTALVDLGKPAFKLGLAGINVGWRAHELKVKVTPERQVYRVREKAHVHVSVRLPDGTAPAGGEIALAAVDEGLLQLMPNRSWDLLGAMMGQRAYGVETSTAQMQVVGKRHFGLKALPAGGGGGSQMTRELFDTLLLWKGRVPLSSQGEADVDVPLNDSVTAFRIVAIATAGVERFGTGGGRIRTTQDLMLLSGLPNLVREGDRVKAHFTLRNTTAHPMKVVLSAKLSSLPLAPLPTLSPLTETLAAGEAKEVGWDLSVPVGAEQLQYEIEARAGDGTRDRIRVNQKVVTAVPVRAFQATILPLENSAAIPVEMPKDAIAGRGGVRVAFHSSLLDGMDGVRKYMEEYPFRCLEQEVSRAIALRDPAAWKKIVDKLPSYLDGDGLAKYFPSMPHGSDTLTAYVLSIADEAEWKIPQSQAEKMREALLRFVEGSLVRSSAMPTADLALRKLSALEALSRDPKAKIDGALLSSISIEPNLWPTSGVLDWYALLKRVPSLPDRDSRLKEAEQILRSRITLQGTSLQFSTSARDRLWWLMISEDENAVRTLLTVLDDPHWKEEMPRLVKGALARQQRGHWDLTDANAWGVLAMEKFAKRFEAVPVRGVSRAELPPQTKAVDWQATPKGQTLTFAWPAARESLKLRHDGEGKPWVDLLSLAAVPLREPLWAGYQIEKTIVPISQKEKGRWSRGDVARVKLRLSSQADMTWVVVSDPIPAGAAILGTGLGNDSSLETQGEKQEGFAYPAYEERSFEAFRSYYQWVPKGEWTLEYTVRLNNGGTFTLPSTRVEAMYQPEIFGERPNPAWQVSE